MSQPAGYGPHSSGCAASGLTMMTKWLAGFPVDGSSEAEAQEHILVVSENGYGKRSLLEEYRRPTVEASSQTINITEKTGSLMAIKSVKDDDDLMIINKSGITIRVSVADIRVAGRATQGVKVISLKEGDSIAAVCSAEQREEEDAGCELQGAGCE